MLLVWLIFILISVNLITNPNFEAKEWSKSGETIEIKTEPWELQKTGGDGWKLEKTPLGIIFRCSFYSYNSSAWLLGKTCFIIYEYGSHFTIVNFVAFFFFKVASKAVVPKRQTHIHIVLLGLLVGVKELR